MKEFTDSEHGTIGCLGIEVISIATGCKAKSNTIPPPPVVEVATATQAHEARAEISQIN